MQASPTYHKVPFSQRWEHEFPLSWALTWKYVMLKGLGDGLGVQQSARCQVEDKEKDLE
jgi:hypothetical protein